MNFGLSERTIGIILRYFKSFPEIERVLIYGSRAKGDYRNGSDIDFALFGDSLTYEMQSRIAMDLYNLSTPYKFDVTLYSSSKNTNLKEHIDRVGQVFYEKS